MINLSFVLSFWDCCSKVLFSLLTGYFLYYQLCINRLCLLSGGDQLSLHKYWWVLSSSDIMLRFKCIAYGENTCRIFWFVLFSELRIKSLSFKGFTLLNIKPVHVGLHSTHYGQEILYGEKGLKGYVLPILAPSGSAWTLKNKKKKNPFPLHYLSSRRLLLFSEIMGQCCFATHFAAPPQFVFWFFLMLGLHWRE